MHPEREILIGIVGRMVRQKTFSFVPINDAEIGLNNHIINCMECAEFLRREVSAGRAQSDTILSPIVRKRDRR